MERKKLCHRSTMYPQVHEIQRLTDISKFSWKWNLLSFKVCSLVKLAPHRCRGKSCCVCIRLHPLLFLFTDFCDVESVYGILCFTFKTSELNLQSLNSSAYLSFFLVQLKLQIATNHLIVQPKQMKHCSMKDYELIDHCWMMQFSNNKVYT